MKTIKIIIAALLITFTSCEDFTDINKSVATVKDIDPMTLLYQVQSNVEASGGIWYDTYATRTRWLQYSSNIWGSAKTSFSYHNSLIGAELYSTFLATGGYTRHIEYYANNHTDTPEAYTHLIQVAKIMLVWKSITASDSYGSLAYTDGWNMRAGGVNEEPKFENQETLFAIWDTELKEAIVELKAATNQKSLQGYDMAYNGDMTKWVKAANALRLRIALRIWKRKPNEAIKIATEVLASTDIFQNNSDGFILRFDKLFTTDGNWESMSAMNRASAPFMKYLKKYDDPRKRLFFKINNLTPENIVKYNNLQTSTSTHITPNMSRWEGGTVSYDFRTTDEAYFNRNLSDGTDMRAMNDPQVRLWRGMNSNGSGGAWFPLITYADFCFMASEFVLSGVSSSKTAQEWYEAGVRSSLQNWSDMANFSKINDYVAISEDEIADFVSQPGIAWDAAIGKEQIYCQTWVEHFKNANEAWTLWLRTGYPNQQSTIVTFDKVLIDNIVQTVPRKIRLSSPTPGTSNYQNIMDSHAEMESNPEFKGILNEYGRLWWDKE